MKFLQTLKKVFTRNVPLKLGALVLAFVVAVVIGAIAGIPA